MAKVATPIYFTKIDLKNGYWQIPIAEEDKRISRTAFVTHEGLYHCKAVMPVGLC